MGMEMEMEMEKEMEMGMAVLAFQHLGSAALDKQYVLLQIAVHIAYLVHALSGIVVVNLCLR